MPKISIITPAYNAERTILETIKSVQKQTFWDFEWTVINNGSTDRTLEILQSIKDERLKIISYDKNRGIPGACNHGISLATGDFIAFLDSDDVWSPDKLELQLAALKEHPEAGVAYSWTYNMNDKGELLYPAEAVFTGNVYADLLIGNFVASGSNALICRQAIESVIGFDPMLPNCADWDFYLRLAARWPFVVIPKHQIFYRRSPGSMSAKISLMKQDALITLERAFSSALPELQHLKNRSFANVYQYGVEVYFLNINYNISEIEWVIENLWKALCLYPQSLLTTYTQRLVIKVLIIKAFSPETARLLLRFISKITRFVNRSTNNQKVFKDVFFVRSNPINGYKNAC